MNIFKSELLFNDNLSVSVSLNSKNILDHKLLNDLIINLKINNGRINFDNSKISIDKIGLLKINNSELNSNGNKIIFTSDVIFNIKNSDNFFSFFQTQKKIRKQIDNISLSLDFDLINNKLNIRNFAINNKDSEVITKNTLDLLNNEENRKIINLIAFKILVNKILTLHLG